MFLYKKTSELLSTNQCIQLVQWAMLYFKMLCHASRGLRYGKLVQCRFVSFLFLKGLKDSEEFYISDSAILLEVLFGKQEMEQGLYTEDPVR